MNLEARPIVKMTTIELLDHLHKNEGYWFLVSVDQAGGINESTHFLSWWRSRLEECIDAAWGCTSRKQFLLRYPKNLGKIWKVYV